MLRGYCEVFSCGQAKYIFFVLPKRLLKKATTRCQKVMVQVSFFSAVTVVPSRLVISAFIVTLPLPLAVTLPFASTAATDGSEELHFTL